MVSIQVEDVNLKKFIKAFTYTGSGDAGKIEIPVAVFFETASLLKIADSIEKSARQLN